MTVPEDRPTVLTGDDPPQPADPGPQTAATVDDPQEEPASRQHAEASGMDSGPLVPEDAAMDFRARWEAAQQGFVDDPRTAVTDADRLVGDVLQQLSKTFEQQHQDMERQWSDGEPSTEDMRTALQRYRTFFDRLLTI